MKIYLASTAPGFRERELNISKRLLSFYFITNDMLENRKVFLRIKKQKRRKCERDKQNE